MDQAGQVALAEPPTRALIYLETSAILSAILGQEVIAPGGIAQVTRFTSALTLVETSRVIARGEALGGLTIDEGRRARSVMDLFFTDCDIVSLSDGILLRAGRRFPVEPVRALDAIHLATIESVGISPHLVRVVTRDRHVRENARAMGYDCPD